MIFEPKATSDVYRRLRIPEPEGEQRAQRQIQRMADARQREIKLVRQIDRKRDENFVVLF